MINRHINSNSLSEYINKSFEFIYSKIGSYKPEIGIILGTGLGGLVKEVDIKFDLDYNDIPYFPVSTVESHKGKLLFGEIYGHKVMIMQGRFHFYEGYKMSEITYPINIMQKINIRTLLVSNACGSVNPFFRKGDLMIMRDHLNFQFDSPLKFFSLRNSNKSIYDLSLIRMAEKIAVMYNIAVKKGVYCTLQGPNLETRSEYRMARMAGADVVGMSTVPESLLSMKHNIKVLGFSIITDEGYPESLKPAVLEEILSVAAEAEPKLTLLIKKIIQKL
jgi:purine-nucleoside phosphorylase